MSLSSDRNAPAFELIVDSDSGCFCSYTFSTGLTPGIEKAKSFRRRMLFTRTKNSLGELSTLTLDVPVAAVPGSTVPRPSSPLRLHGVSTLAETPRPA